MPLVADAAPLRSKIRVARLRAVFPAPTTFYFFRYRSFLVFVTFFFFSSSSSFLGHVLLSLLPTVVLCFAFLSRRLCERAQPRRDAGLARTALGTTRLLAGRRDFPARAIIVIIGARAWSTRGSVGAGKNEVGTGPVGSPRNYRGRQSSGASLPIQVGTAGKRAK